MTDFDAYTLWILEQHKQRAHAKYLTMYVQFRQEQARQPRLSLWRALGTYLHRLMQTMRVLSTRRALPPPFTHDTPCPIQDPVALVSTSTPQMDRRIRQEKRGVAAGP